MSGYLGAIIPLLSFPSGSGPIKNPSGMQETASNAADLGLILLLLILLLLSRKEYFKYNWVLVKGLNSQSLMAGSSIFM